VLTGGTGTDKLYGGMGNDTYVFNLGDGKDTIIEMHGDSSTSSGQAQGTDTLQFGDGISSALTAILQEFKDNWQKIYEELEKLRKRIIEAANELTYGLHKKKQMLFFRMFQADLGGAMEQHPAYLDKPDDRIAVLVDLTQQVYLVVERELKLTSFGESVPARNKLKAEIQQILLSETFGMLPNVVKNRNQIISRVMEIAEKNNDRILYAA
jgi:type I restriction enzyme R subunit